MVDERSRRVGDFFAKVNVVSAVVIAIVAVVVLAVSKLT